MLLDQKIHLLNLTHIANMPSKIDAPIYIPCESAGECPAWSHLLVIFVEEEIVLATTVSDGEHMAIPTQAKFSLENSSSSLCVQGPSAKDLLFSCGFFFLFCFWIRFFWNGCNNPCGFRGYVISCSLTIFEEVPRFFSACWVCVTFYCILLYTYDLPSRINVNSETPN